MNKDGIVLLSPCEIFLPCTITKEEKLKAIQSLLEKNAHLHKSIEQTIIIRFIHLHKDSEK